MFKITESIGDPINLPVKPGIKLLPGNIVSIIEYGDDLAIDLYHSYDGKSPFGIVGKRFVSEDGAAVDLTKTVKVYFHRMVVELTKFDKFNKIEVGSSLYAHKKGILTSKKPYNDSVLLAKVISPKTDEKKFISILWL